MSKPATTTDTFSIEIALLNAAIGGKPAITSVFGTFVPLHMQWSRGRWELIIAQGKFVGCNDANRSVRAAYPADSTAYCDGWIMIERYRPYPTHRLVWPAVEFCELYNLILDPVFRQRIRTLRNG